MTTPSDTMTSRRLEQVFEERPRPSDVEGLSSARKTGLSTEKLSFE